MRSMQIPLFPLHAVLTPGLALSLHVFEERYRVMVRHCLDTATPFGIVFIREGCEVAPRDGHAAELAISGVGTFAEIREANRYSDGRWDLLTVGAGRFVIESVHTELEPYLVADVQRLDDTVGDADTADALVERVIRRFAEYLQLLQPRDGESAPSLDIQVEVEVSDEAPGSYGSRSFESGSSTDEPTETHGVTDDRERPDAASSLRIPSDPSQLSFLLSGIVQVGAARKQALLEAGSAADRLRDIDRLLDHELVLLRRRLGPYLVDRGAFTDRLA
jgi:Lon protease-like protein